MPSFIDVAVVSVDFPLSALHPGGERATLRTSLNNNLRPAMERTVARMRQVSRYQKIAPGYRVQQDVTADLANYAIVNDKAGSQYVVKGSAPHWIYPRNGGVLAFSVGPQRVTQIRGATAGGTFIAPGGMVFTRSVYHPGIRPDQPALDEVDRSLPDLVNKAADMLQRWALRFGEEVV